MQVTLERTLFCALLALGEGTIDQPPVAAGARGVLGKPAVGPLLRGSPCWLTENGAPRGSRGLLAMPDGSGTPGGRALASGANPVASWPGRNKAGGAVVFRPATSAGGVAARLNMPKRTPHEQSAKATRTRGLKKPDWELGFFILLS